MAIVLWVASLVITVVVTWVVSWYFYRKSAAALHAEVVGISTVFSGSPREVGDRLQAIARATQVDVRTVEKVLVTLKDEELTGIIRRELRRLQGHDGNVQRNELLMAITSQLPPGSFNDIQRVIEAMRERGEIEYIGCFNDVRSLRYKPTASREHLVKEETTNELYRGRRFGRYADLC